VSGERLAGRVAIVTGGPRASVERDGDAGYSADMSKHAYFGTDESLRAENVEYAERL
jgi:hypothetical protein